jgi:hypothetical protein
MYNLCFLIITANIQNDCIMIIVLQVEDNSSAEWVNQLETFVKQAAAERLELEKQLSWFRVCRWFWCRVNNFKRFSLNLMPFYDALCYLLQGEVELKDIPSLYSLACENESLALENDKLNARLLELEQVVCI